MKIVYLKLINSAGIFIGQNKTEIEIDFSKSINKIIALVAENASGKSTLLNSFIPFASISTSLDERGTLPYIIPGKSGYKELHYIHNADRYIIKHYFKPTKEGSHTVKSYFQLNDEELNENGNVGSFNSLVELHFGLTPDMIRLVRLGSNINSFISLKPAERKGYLGKLINEIELYLSIHKKINEDLRVTRTLLSTNSSSIHQLQIHDINIEIDKLLVLRLKEKDLITECDSIRLRISKIESMEAENDLDELRKKYKEAESSIISFHKTKDEISKYKLSNTSVDELIKERNNLNNKYIEVKANINSLKLMIDSHLSKIDSLSVSMKKNDSNNNVNSLISLISDLKSNIKGTNKNIRELIPSCTSEEIGIVINKLNSLNQISSIIQTFGNKSLNLYIQLRENDISIKSFIEKQTKEKLAKLNEKDIKSILTQIFSDDFIIAPNCEYEFNECPYYRLASIINNKNVKKKDDSYDEENIRYLKVIADNISLVNEEVRRLSASSIPDRLKVILNEKLFLSRLENKLSFFDIGELHDYMSLVKANEIYNDQVKKLNQYQHELEIYKHSGIDQQVQEINRIQTEITKYKSNIIDLQKESDLFQSEINQLESKIGLLTSYNDGVKYQKLLNDIINNTKKILEPLERANTEKNELQYRLDIQESSLRELQSRIKELDQKIDRYNSLISDSKYLSSLYDKLSKIAESVSTKSGIPIVYMNHYLGRIQKLTNELLSIIYEGSLSIGTFQVSADEFRIPFIRNGVQIPDVRYASQSETSLISMALSFAIANGANQQYNILLLDEIDAGLDSNNREAFLRMLHRQMIELKSEQTFIISHNISDGMLNVPIDVIKLSDVDINSNLHNIIYEA